MKPSDFPVIRQLTADTVNQVVAKGTGDVNVAWKDGTIDDRELLGCLHRDLRELAGLVDPAREDKR